VALWVCPIGMLSQLAICYGTTESASSLNLSPVTMFQQGDD